VKTGCIPTCYEILLRAAGVTGIDYASFQDDFDLDQDGGAPRNHFISVAEEIQRKYPFVEFACDSFTKGDGDKKLARVEDLIFHRKPVIVSLANAHFGGHGWHIMVVVDATEDALTLLEYVDPNGAAKTKTISKKEFIRVHNHYPGGVEIAYLWNPKVLT
jgi:hypothetical protein